MTRQFLEQDSAKLKNVFSVSIMVLSKFSWKTSTAREKEILESYSDLGKLIITYLDHLKVPRIEYHRWRESKQRKRTRLMHHPNGLATESTLYIPQKSSCCLWNSVNLVFFHTKKASGQNYSSFHHLLTFHPKFSKKVDKRTEPVVLPLHGPLYEQMVNRIRSWNKDEHTTYLL